MYLSCSADWQDVPAHKWKGMGKADVVEARSNMLATKTSSQCAVEQPWSPEPHTLLPALYHQIQFNVATGKAAADGTVTALMSTTR
jgi:hypothetical protein